MSPKGYRFAKNYLSLPSENVLKSLINNDGFDEGVNVEALEALKIAAKSLTEKERICSKFLIFFF